MKLKLLHTIRGKITLAFTILLTFISILLTLITLNSSNRLVDTIHTQPSEYIDSLPLTESLNNSAKELPAETVIPAQEIVTAKKNFDSVIWVSMTFAVLLGSIIIYFYTKKLLKPLEELTEKVQDVDVTNMKQTFKLPSATQEILQLSESFQHMVDRIHIAYEMQKNFSSNAAHELRTPLALLQTQLDVFQLESNHTEQQVNTLVTQLQDHTKRLSSIVIELLELTNEREVPINQPIYLIDLFEELFLTLEDTATQHQIKLSLVNKTPQESPMVLGNDSLLERAFFNLIENALKYNQENGSVTVYILQENTQISIKIVDTGIGIPSEEINKIFEPFYRIDKSRSRLVGGSGLGLALVEKILLKHNATITITPNTPHGTCVTVTF